jgi:hypothetical protein
VSPEGNEVSLLLGGTGSEDAALACVDRDVVDAGFPPAHQTILGELPPLVTVAAPPLAGAVVAFVLEARFG